MANEFEQRKKSAYSTRRSIMDIGMGILWSGMGLLFIFKDLLGVALDFPDKPYDYIFGGLCLVYGVFRIYRGIKKNYF
jgi:hypothetical protein